MDKLPFYKVGQVLLTRGTGFFSKSIQIGMGHYYSHALWIREVKEYTLVIQQASGSTTKTVSTSEVDKAYFDRMFNEGRLKICDFGIRDYSKFQDFCERNEGNPYDYFAILELGLARFFALFGTKMFKKYLQLKLVDWVFTKFRKKHTTPKVMDCSELVARGLNNLLNLDVLGRLKANKYEEVTPQDLSVLYDHFRMQSRE